MLLFYCLLSAFKLQTSKPTSCVVYCGKPPSAISRVRKSPGSHSTHIRVTKDIPVKSAYDQPQEDTDILLDRDPKSGDTERNPIAKDFLRFLQSGSLSDKFATQFNAFVTLIGNWNGKLQTCQLNGQTLIDAFYVNNNALGYLHDKELDKCDDDVLDMLFSNAVAINNKDLINYLKSTNLSFNVNSEASRINPLYTGPLSYAYLHQNLDLIDQMIFPFKDNIYHANPLGFYGDKKENGDRLFIDPYTPRSYGNDNIDHTLCSKCFANDAKQ